MLGSPDQIVLQIFGKIREVSAVAGDSHKQIAVLLRLPLRIQKRLSINNVELEMP
ncbi:hypothetical protein D3C77_738110 [compost metagenome]